ncbi:MAG: hypothetical protein KBD65_03605 [Candidatus Moranbacteria bacterium]|nr:hypothetical protein [Candidatus Moranbacteria bacterium]
MADLNKSFYYPMIVSGTGTVEPLSHDEDVLVWKKFLSMSQLKQDIITDAQVPKKIAELQEKFQLAEALVGVVSLHIRKVFFEEMSLSDVETSLKNVLVSGSDDASKAKMIVDFIQKEILTIKPQPKTEEVPEEEAPKHVATTIRLPLLQALSKYEQLGNQLITEERLKLKSQGETVRPSLLYWIKYYRDELGVGHHSSVDRGNFLFRSENGKKLTPEERERVNLVLRSVEENVPLDIDTEQSIILFPAFVPPAPTPRPTLPPMAPQRPAFQPSGSAVFQPAPPVQPGAMSFSSKHVLPAEKAASEAPVSTPTPRPVVAPRPATPVTPVAPKRNPFHIRPVSMGKEE